MLLKKVQCRAKCIKRVYGGKSTNLNDVFRLGHSDSDTWIKLTKVNV